jgi:CRISPR-associated protein Cmr2
MESLKEKFVHAVAFCLRGHEHEGDIDALARWALSPEDETPAPGNENLQVALVSGGATRIKSYVFESARLPEIRGASGLLDRINTKDTQRLWSDAAPHGVGCEDCIVYANGGEVLAFAPVSRAAWLADEIERLYRHATLVAQSVAVWQPFTLRQLRDGLLAGQEVNAEVVRQLLGYNPADNRSFGSLVAALALARFRRREANADGDREPRSPAHIETVPFARRCSSCERRGAVVNARVADEDRPLCEPCARKRVYGQTAKGDDAHAWGWYTDEGLSWKPRQQPSWASQFSEWIEKQSLEGRCGYPVGNLTSAEDLSEIAQASNPDGFIGVIYADGNNVGAQLERLTTPTNYSEFATALFDATKDAVFKALARHLCPHEVFDKRGRRKRIHPFEILSIGGDDLLLIVPAHVALAVACTIASEVEERLRHLPLFTREAGYEWERAQRCKRSAEEHLQPQSRVSLSAGVAIADAHTPVFYLEQLAEQLLKAAKRYAKWLKRERDYYGGTIDFLSLKSVSMISGTVEQFRTATQTRGHKRLHARPYTVAETRALLGSIKLLKASRFPRNQLYRLHDSLREDDGTERGTIDYLYFLTRNANEAREQIEELWTPQSGAHLPHPWRVPLDSPAHRQTIWSDLAELYDFVPGEEEEDGDAGVED